MDSSFPKNIVVENSLASVKITINKKKRWGKFIILLIQLLLIIFFVFPVIRFLVETYLENHISEKLVLLVWIMIGGFLLYRIYQQIRAILDSVPDKEIIEINSQNVVIEKRGLGLKIKNEFPAENIVKISAMFPLGENSMVNKRPLFIKSDTPMLVLWFDRKIKRYHTFGRTVDIKDAHQILEVIYSRFPQYEG